MDISVVIPVHNEAENVGQLYKLLNAVLGKLGKDYEILFVDDGSSDNTVQEVKKIIDSDGRVKAVRLMKRFGKSIAYSAGFEQSKGDVIITIDGDLQDDPDEILRFLQRLEDGYDLVCGWRLRRQDPFWKTIPSWFFNSVASFLTGVKIHDLNCGFKAYRRKAAEKIDIYGELYRFIPVLVAGEGFSVGEIAVKHYPRKYGKSKYGLNKLPKGFFDLLTVLILTKYAKKPLHFFGGIGLTLASLGFAIDLYLSLLKIFFGQTIGNRPLLLFGTLLIISGIQLISLGLLAEMMTKMDYRKTPHSWIKEIITKEGAR